MSKDIDLAKIYEIYNSQSTSSKVEGDKGIQDTEDNGIDVSMIDAIFNANKVEDDATAEQKERLETSFALGNLNRSFMGKQMAEIRRSIPDTTEQEAYDYLTTDAEDGSTEAIRGTALADRIKSGYGVAKGDAEDREFVQTKYSLADELVATLPLADPINSTDVMVGANRMPRGQAERVMAQVVENTMHPDLLKSNEAYRNNFFMENYGTTAEKYLIDLDKKLVKLQVSLDKEIKRDMDAMPSLMRGGVAGGVDPRAVQSFVESESYGGNTIRNAREKIQSILNNNFASGVDEGFDALSALSLGINDIMSGVSINNILSKSAAGKPLTKRESVALEAYDISEELEGLQDIIAPQSWGNKVGQGLGTTAEMAMPFIPAMSIAGSVGKLATLPIRASAKLTRRAFNKGVVNGVTTGMKRAASLAGKSLHNVGVSTLSGLVVAPLMPSTWSTFVDNRNKRFEIKDGKVVAHDRSVWKDLANAWIESAVEIGSERIGIRMDELIRGSASSLGRALAIDNLSSKAGKVLFGGKTPAYIKSLQQKAGFTGYLSEPLSEVWGDAVVNLMKMGLTGDDNFAEMGNADYWTTTLATCALYGTGLKMATEGLPMTKRIADIERMGRYRKNALNGIESESLYNTMVSILAEEDIEAAAKRLSEIEWNKYHRIDIGHAMDAIRAHYAQSVALSSETETARLNSFMGQVGDIANITYRGKEGNENTNEVVTITDKNGVKYMAISGDSTTPFYVCLDANLERINILSSDVVDISRTSLEERMATAYSEQFSTEIEMERQQQLIDRYNEVRAGVGGIDAINRVRTLFGAEEHHSGDDVTLADGTQAIVEEYLPETGEYVVTKVDGTMECVPFYNILSTNAFTAEAQSLSFAQRALSTAENEIDIEEDIENSTETEQIAESDTTEDGALAVGDVVIIPTGERVRIRAINEDGSFEVDYNTAERVSPEDMEIEVFDGADLKAESAEEVPAQDVLTDVDASPISEGVEETVTEETAPVAPQIENKPIPTNEDGTINYEAIEDPKQFVDLYSHEAGGIDTAITDVKEMRDSAVAEVAKNAEQGKKITSPNEKIANRKKQETLAQKVAFYDSVLAELEQRVKPTEDAENATPVEDVVDVVEAETAEDITEDATTSEPKKEEAQPKEVGLIDNELSKDLRKPIYNTLNALGEALGIQIELVDAIDGVKANGQIIGNRIQIAWKDRMKAVTFIAGHEFLHRLKDIAPEQYEKFKESVKNDLGEDGFATRINRMRRNYEYTNEQRIKKDQEPLAYTDTLLEEEVIADRMGEYVENAEAFNHYLESIKPQNTLLRAIRDAWAYIKNLFKGTEYRAETKRINDMLEAIDALINAGASAIKKAQGTEHLGERNAVQGKERHSIIGEQGAEALDNADEAEIAKKEAEVSESTERLREQGAIVDAERGDVRYSIADVLTGDQREQAIADLMRVTGRSRRTVINYLKAEESLANIILSGDNKAFLDIQVDESVPSIWSNSDYPQGTVEFSNICRKRLPFTMIYQRLQKDFPNTVFDASSLESIRQTLIANGEEVACGLCFVEDRRQLLGEIGQGFINALSGKEIELNEKQREAISRLQESGDTYIPNLYELITLDGMKILRKEHPEVANAFVAYNNARGMQAGRLFQAYSAYHRDILNYDAKKVAKINDAGGLRIFSFSDFEAHHLIDLVQVLTDCAAKGIKVQGYTKVPQFAKAVKDTKMKVNRSLIAKAKGVVEADYIPQEGEAVSPNIIDGKRLLFDTVEGIDVNSPDFFDSTDSKSVGNILVGINDEHIRIAMLDPFVDYIIGFHTGLSEAIREQKGIADWTNYKYTQLEKILKDGKLVNADKHGINIYTEVLTPEIKTERQFVREYLKVCEEKGWIPKYHRFLKKSKSGKFIYTKGYYKLLLDFKMFDKNGKILPQEVVVPVFDNEVNKQILEDYVADEKAKAPNDELYGKVVDAMVERGVLTEAQAGEAMSQPKFSLQTINALTDALAEYNANGDITSFVDSVRAENERFGGHQYLTNLIMDYEEDGDAEWFAEKIKGVIGEANEDYAPYTTEGVKYSLSEETAQIFDAAKAKFGTTYDMREAGYILPDGSMLDFSGRHQVEGDASFLNGNRTVDHREISDVAYDADDNETGIKTDLGDFLDRGAIRIDYNAGAINLNVAPTKAQKDRLKRLIERNEGYVYVDFGKGWDTEHYAEYEAARASRVLGDIDRYFDEGIKPTGNVRLSLQDVEAHRFNRKVEFVKGLVRNYNIPNPLFIAETKEEFVQMVKDYDGKVDEYTANTYGYYSPDDDIILLNGGMLITSGDAHRSTMHEYAHSITKKYLGEKLAEVTASIPKEDISKASNELLGKAYDKEVPQIIIDEFVSYLVESLSIDERKAIFEGDLVVDEYIETLRNEINSKNTNSKDVLFAVLPLVKENLLLQKEQYGREKENTIVLPRYEYRRLSTDAKKEGGTLWRTEAQHRPNEAGYGVYEAGRGGEGTPKEEVTPRHSIHSADSDATGARITEETVRTYMKRGHQVTKANIRKKYKAYRDVAKNDYAEKRRVRLDKIKTLLTNSAKVDYIFGDIDEYSTPYLHQAFSKIARGEVRIVWDNSPDGKKRGIASETGAKKGEKQLYASITNGATLYFEEYVHQWWQELNGYENDIDTQELRNALIEALSEVCNANGAISKLREIYDNDQKVLDEALDVYDREEDRELADETARYEQEVADFEQNKDAKISEFESSLSFFDELAVIDGTISEMRSKLEKILEKSRSRVATEKMNTREIREAITEIKRLIKNAIDRQTIASMQRNELRSMLDKIDKARSINQVSAIAVEIENTILEAKIRFKRRELDKLLHLRIPDGTSVSQWVDTQVKEGLMSVADSRTLLEDMWRGRNSSGVSVAKFVDPATAKTMEELRKLVMQTLKTKIVEDVDAEERGKVFRRDEELSLDVEAAIESNNARLDELANKKATQERIGVDKTPTSQRYTDADAHEYAARSIYDTYLRTIALKQDIADIAKDMDDVRIDYYGMADKVAVRDHYLDMLFEEMVEARRKYAEALENLNNDIMQLMREGKDALSAFRMEQNAHKSSIVKLGLDALRVNTKLLPDKGNVWERTKAFLRGTTNASYNTFQTTLKEIDRFAPNGEGRFYNYFMGLWQECENKLFTQHSDNCSAVASMLRTTLGLKGKNDADIISAIIEQADAKFLGTITYSKGVDRTGDLIEPEEKPITVSTAMFIIAMWRQTMYRNSLIKHGIDQQMIDALYDLVNKENKGYITFMNWVNESLLPNTRLVYDKVHREMFGASMAEERNYFPARVVNFQETVDVGNDNEGALPSTITGAIINRKKNALMPDITQNYFKVLMGHLQEMDQWSAFAPLIRDLNTLLSNTEFKNACRQYKGGVKADRKGLGDLYSIFRNVSAIAVGAYKPKRNDIEDAILKAMRGWAGSNIAWRLLTAIKQLSSMPVFALYALDGKMQKEFVKSIAYCLSHPKAVSKWAMANSPQFRKRWESKFAGLDILNTTIGAEDGIADLNSWSKTKWGRGSKMIDKGIRKVASEMGMSPNAFVDAISVVVGLRTIYNYELNKLMERDSNTTPNDKQKYEAMRKAEVVFNTTQQSGESAYLSTVQSDRSLVLRGLTIYQNSPFAFHRLMVSGVSEIAKQMTNAEYRNAIREEYGDKALSDARKKAYAQLMQSAAGSYLFALMGQAIANGFYSLVGGDDDEYRSYKNVQLGATATFLFGGVVGGAVIISGLQGYGFSLTAAWDDAVKSIEKLLNVDNWLSGEAVYEAINIVARYKYGVDLDTFTNIATGIQGYFEGSGNVEATMKILNAPRSQVNLVAGVRRDDETIMEYVTRRMRVQSLLSVPDYNTLFSEDGAFIGKGVLRNNPFRVSEYQAKEYKKEYAESYNNNVVTRFGGASQLSTMKEIDSKYAEGAKAIGITPNSIPSSKTAHKVLNTNGNEEYLIRLLEAQMEVGVAHKELESFVGVDENYYKKAVELNKAKENFISIYDELNK